MLDWHIYIIIGILWAVSLLAVRRKNENGLLSNLFQTNADLDTTLQIILKSVIVVATLLIVIIFFMSFHDDLSSEHVGMLAMHVVSMASLAISNVTGNGHSNGKKEDKSDG